MNELQQSVLEKIKNILKITLNRKQGIYINNYFKFIYDWDPPEESVLIINCYLYKYTIRFKLRDDKYFIETVDGVHIGERLLIKALSNDFDFDLEELSIMLDEILIGCI